MADKRELPTREQTSKGRRYLRLAKEAFEGVTKATDPAVAWAGWITAARHADHFLRHVSQVMPEPPDTGTAFRAEPLDFPADQFSKRTMQAVQRAFAEEFADDDFVANVTIICTMPPDGRVAVASTEPDPNDILDALRMGWGAIHRTARLVAERASRQ